MILIGGAGRRIYWRNNCLISSWRHFGYQCSVSRNRFLYTLSKGRKGKINALNNSLQKLKNQASVYASLGKLKLSTLVMATTAAGFQLGHGHGDWKIFGCSVVGVGLSSLAANALNQWIELPFDSQMKRTMNRPLPRHALGTLHVFNFAIVSGSVGTCLLWWQCGWLPAALAAVNIFLYAAVYTPLKRSSIWNTFVGSVVGSIPPMIGFLSASPLSPSSLYDGGGATGISLLNNNGLHCALIGGILFAWQFPHFMGLSWYLRRDYSRAGFCMAAVLRPAHSLNVALLSSIAIFPISALFSASALVDPYFTLTSSSINSILLWLAVKFWKHPNNANAKRLFLFTLLHLPLFFLLAIFHKKRNHGSDLIGQSPCALLENINTTAAIH